MGDPTFTTTVPAAVGGGTALAFDDDGDYVAVQGDESDFDFQELTIAFWIKTPGFTDGYEGLVTKGDSSWRVHESDGSGYVEFYANGLSDGLRSTQLITDDVWHHFAVTYDGSDLTIYVDGALDISAARSGTISHTNAPVAIGTNSDITYRYFNGLLDEVRIYNRALSATDVAQLYAHTVDRCFAEITGDEITDFASIDAGAVQAALHALEPTSDTIKLAGTCAGVQERVGISQTVYISRNLTLQGGYTSTNWKADPDPDLYPTTLDAEGKGRVILVNADRVTLEGLRLVNGAPSGGNGGALQGGTDVTLTQVSVLSSTGNYGGGIYYAGSGTLLIQDSLLRGNQALANAPNGGAIYQNGGTLLITGTLITGNAGNWAGGLRSTDATVVSSTIGDNSASHWAGGIYNVGALTLSHTTVEHNRANNGVGGGILNDGALLVTTSTVQYNWGQGIHNLNSGHLVIHRSYIYSNTAYEGGGIYNRNALTVTASTVAHNVVRDFGAGLLNVGRATLLNTTVSGNTSSAYGGGILQQGLSTSELHLLHATVVGNSAVVSGDGIHLITGTAHLTHTLVAHNGIANCVGDGSFISGGYNLEDGDTCGLTATGDVTGTEPLLDPLADNGGATPTHRPYGFSPAVDAIPTLDCVLSTDQRGEPRPANDGCDVGALELVVSGGVAWGADSSIVTVPDDVVTHTFVLTNTGNVVDAYDLTLAGHAWPTVVPSDTGVLEPGARVTVPVVVWVPDDPRAPLVIIGSDTFTLTARSWADGTEATATGTTQASATPALALSGDQAGSDRMGGFVTYTLWLTNTGTFTDTVGLAAGGGSWPVALSTTSLLLGEGEMGPVVVTVTVPTTATPGSTDGVTVTATSGLDALVNDHATLTTMAEAWIYLPLVTREG
jgi:hypothetical protein